MRRLTLVMALLAAVLPAQQWSNQGAVHELEQLVLTRTWRDQWAVLDQKIAAWLGRVEKSDLDLGEHSHAPAIALYFEHDYQGAGRLMLEYFRKHDSLPTRNFDQVVGRILLGATIKAIRDGDLARRYGQELCLTPSHQAALFSSRIPSTNL